MLAVGSACPAPFGEIAFLCRRKSYLKPVAELVCDKAVVNC